jgi:hypothetical protein
MSLGCCRIFAVDEPHRQAVPAMRDRSKNWLFAGTLAAGQRAAAITRLIQSAKVNGLDPYAYLKDVLERLPTQRPSAIDALLPHCWAPAIWAHTHRNAGDQHDLAGR